MQKLAGSYLLLLTGMLWSLPAPFAEAASIRTQNPCSNVGSACLVLIAPGPSLAALRRFSFNLPGNGPRNVMLQFHGTLVCTSENTEGNTVVDFETQITTSSGGEPGADQDGGLRHAATLEAMEPNARSLTFNLASTRTVRYASGGNKSVYFNLSTLRMDSGTTCSLYNAAFSAVI